MRLAPDRILYKRNKCRGRVYRWSICGACGRLWYTLDAIRNVIKRDGCSLCLYPGGRKLAGVPAAIPSATRLPPKRIPPRRD